MKHPAADLRVTPLLSTYYTCTHGGTVLKPVKLCWTGCFDVQQCVGVMWPF